VLLTIQQQCIGAANIKSLGNFIVAHYWWYKPLLHLAYSRYQYFVIFDHVFTPIPSLKNHKIIGERWESLMYWCIIVEVVYFKDKSNVSST
jgi:hypothetical protein